MGKFDHVIARTPTERKPVKKALLIGSGLVRAPRPEGCPVTYPALGRAVGDTRELAGLLISAYGYIRENIVVLVDEEGVDPTLTPTKVNILRELHKLTKGAKPEDHFFFFYAGHSDRTSSDDGEPIKYIVPCDYWKHPEEVPITERMILSHELRRFLVDSLPVDASLYAIIDACYSGRLLELLHYRCNDIYIPWISPGIRKCATQWRGVRRKDGCIMDDIDLALGRTLSYQASVDRSATLPDTRKSSMSSLRIIQHKRLSKDEVRIVDTSVKVLNGTGKHRQVSVTRRQSSMQRQTSSSLHQVLEDAHTTTRTESPDVFDDLHRCASPTEETEETEFLDGVLQGIAKDLGYQQLFIHPGLL
ncbi:Metacaspase-1 [Trametes pubescens]|uniref:Metacaspase-1 n=1 Tax=Trametes pubescens TaxID=154538 RepID=A0A1M2VM99_TRAPU|nr:Metacaspase-1 [Trametes pubescens]